MHRRVFIKRSSLTALGISLLGAIQWNGTHVLKDKIFKVNGQRIESRITTLAKFGRREDGHGYRVAYTKGDIEGRAWYMDLMKKAGLDVII